MNQLKQAFDRTAQFEGYGAPSAVLVPLMEVNGQLCLLFTQRALHMKHQPGDYCFPGGHHEADETPQETALREVWEEIGIPAEKIEILGPCDIVLSSFGAYIMPFVGLVHDWSMEEMVLNRDEVEQVLPVPLQFVFETEPRLHIVPLKPDFPPDFPFHLIVGGKNYRWGKATMKDWFYLYQDAVIWGLTARIVNNVKAILLAAGYTPSSSKEQQMLTEVKPAKPALVPEDGKKR